jgi:hypothetical protein
LHLLSADRETEASDVIDRVDRSRTGRKQKEYHSMNWQKLGSAIWRGMKVMPIIGYVFILAEAPAVIRRKGVWMGVLAIVLDILPIICLIKAAIEIYLGDLIPDRLQMLSSEPLPQSLS